MDAGASGHGLLGLAQAQSVVHAAFAALRGLSSHGGTADGSIADAERLVKLRARHRDRASGALLKCRLLEARASTRHIASPSLVRPSIQGPPRGSSALSSISSPVFVILVIAVAFHFNSLKIIGTFFKIINIHGR